MAISSIRRNLGNDIRAAVAERIQAQGRINRRPEHTFNIRSQPFGIYPFFIAPVLPGETMQHLHFQARIVSDPILNRNIGWWAEHYFFYVKMRDLSVRDTVTAMLLNQGNVDALKHSSGNAYTYVFDDGVDWVQECLECVTENWFRDEGENWDTWLLSAGIPAVKVNKQSVLGSIIFKTDLHSADVELLDISAGTAGGGDDKLMTSEIEAGMRQWQLLKDMELTTMDYEDFLATFGLALPPVELHQPELLRYFRSWQYPVSAINPSTGAAASAVTWALRERADKRRLFTEHGFVFGVQVIRPKVYFKNQTGSIAGGMDTAFSWLPAILADDPRTSLKEFATSEGPFQSVNATYVLDMRDLLIHGDQFFNFANTATGENLIDLPDADLAPVLHPTATMADTLFVAASPANLVRSDGVVAMTIAGRQIDTTPQ